MGSPAPPLRRRRSDPATRISSVVHFTSVDGVAMALTMRGLPVSVLAWTVHEGFPHGTAPSYTQPSPRGYAAQLELRPSPPRRGRGMRTTVSCCTLPSDPSPPLGERAG